MIEAALTFRSQDVVHSERDEADCVELVGNVSPPELPRRPHHVSLMVNALRSVYSSYIYYSDSFFAPFHYSLICP